MMFTMHVAIMLAFIGFIAGLSLYIWSSAMKTQGQV